MVTLRDGDMSSMSSEGLGVISVWQQSWSHHWSVFYPDALHTQKQKSCQLSQTWWINSGLHLACLLYTVTSCQLWWAFLWYGQCQLVAATMAAGNRTCLKELKLNKTSKCSNNIKNNNNVLEMNLITTVWKRKIITYFIDQTKYCGSSSSFSGLFNCLITLYLDQKQTSRYDLIYWTD